MLTILLDDRRLVGEVGGEREIVDPIWGSGL
jgi:hypothetical protein